MSRNQRTGMTASLLLCLAILFGPLAGAAHAGPQIRFGTDNQGVLQIDYKAQFQMLLRDSGSGEDKDDSTASFNFRRNRLAFMGKYGKSIGIYVQTEYTENQNVGPLSVSDDDSGGNFILIDAVMRFRVNDAFHVNVGKFKYNLSRENLEDCLAPLTLDRSLFLRAPFVTTRDRGVAAWGNLFADRFQYRVDVMEGRTATTSAATAPDSSFRFSGRAHVTLLDPEKEYGYKGTYLGKKKVLTAGAAFQYEPDVAFADTVAQAGSKDYTAWAADLFFEYPTEGIGTFTVSGAYENIDLDDAFRGANPDPDTIGLNGEKNGYYVKAGYLLPSLPLQAFGRYEKWNFARLDGIFDQEIQWYSVGANYYFRGQNLKLTMEYSRTNFDVENATSKDFGTFVTQLQLWF